MKQKKWTKEEINLLIKIYSNTSNKKISKIMNVTIKQIANKIKSLRLKGYNINFKYIFWTKKEIKLLKEKYKTESIENLCKILNRSKNAIYAYGFRLKINKDKIHRGHYSTKYTKLILKIDFEELFNEPWFLIKTSKKYKLTKFSLKRKMQEYRIKNDIFVYKINLKNLECDIVYCKNNEKNRILTYKKIKKKYPEHFKLLKNTKIRMIMGKYLKNYPSRNNNYVLE